MENQNNDIKDLSKYFENSPDINIEMTAWKRKDAEHWLFFCPLEPNNAPQQGLQRVGNNIGRIDYLIDEIEGGLYFYDFITKLHYGFHTGYIRDGKILLVKPPEGIAIYEKVSIEALKIEI